MLAFGQPAQCVLDDDDGTVDDEAKVQCAQAHQVAGNAQRVHTDCADQQRQRNDQRRDGRRPHVAQQQEQDHHHQQRAFGQIFRHGFDGGHNQLRAVQRRHDHHARRHRLFDLLELVAHRLRHRAAVGAHQHQRTADHSFIAVAAGCPGAQFAPDLDDSNLADRDRHVLPLRNDRA